MNHDELEARLRRIDPVAAASIHPVSGPDAAVLMEQIMQSTEETPVQATAAPRRPRRFLAIAGAVAVAAVGLFAFIALRGDDPAPTSVTYALSTPNATQMCINIDGIQSDPSWLGFRGTVTDVQPGSVTLDVTEWYRGGDADQVVLTVPEGGAALEGGTEFVVGADMLVGVMDGTTLGCGISGPYSADLAGYYATWFA